MSIRFAATRFLRALPVLLIASLVAFAVLPAPDTAGQGRGASGLLPERYAQFVIGAVQGDFGLSVAAGKPVGVLLGASLPATVTLIALALVISLAVGVPAGLAAAAARRHRAGSVIAAIANLAGLLPPLATGALVWPALAGGVAPGKITTADNANFLPIPADGTVPVIVPALLVGLFLSAPLIRLLRDGMGRAMESGFIRFAWARGLPRYFVFRHAIANALVPVATSATAQLAALIAISAVAEAVFHRPGAGLMLFNAVAARDWAVLSAMLLLASLTFTCTSVASDLVSYALDPRTRPARAVLRTAR